MILQTSLDQESIFHRQQHAGCNVELLGQRRTDPEAASAVVVHPSLWLSAKPEPGNHFSVLHLSIVDIVRSE